MNAQKIIEGIAKTTGKYTLKGLGKGIEFMGRGTVLTVDALVRNPAIQKIATGAGILAAGVMLPSVGVGLISTLGLKYAIDKTFLGSHKGLLDEFDDILRAGSTITRSVSDKILSPTLHSMDRGMNKLGRNYQDKIDDIFR